MGITSAIFSEEPFLQSSSLLYWVAMSSFFFLIRWRKERERAKVKEMVVELLPCGNLIAVIH